MIVDAIIMPGARRRYLVVKIRAVEQCLAHFPEVRLALHFETELLANQARSTIATDQVLSTDRNGFTVCFSDLCRNTIQFLRERQQFMAKFHRQIWYPFRHGFE